MLPLEGTTVVALEHAIAAPFCTRQPAGQGARVIKVCAFEGAPPPPRAGAAHATRRCAVK